MYLKRLELQGFKSFPDKIKLDFNKGITAVVGPNGSGKSNIGDAVRWVLGEKSAKSLRGSKMEDVIFNGTANRKPLGFAEVSMVMDNSDKKLNIDYSEVTVTRRMYRSGESDYLINGTRCRAKDILELFMDTGVGKEGYSIIGQGRIEEILSSKSEDRRLLFEEAAGIVKYRTRSSEAQSKLARERENLVRVNDIISELEGQLSPLEKQAEKAKKAITLSERLKLVEVNRFVNSVEKYEVEIKRLELDIRQLNSDIENQRKTEEVAQGKKEKLRKDLETIEADIENANIAIADKRSEAEQSEAKITLLNQNKEHFNQNLDRIKKEQAAYIENISLKKDEIMSTSAKINAKEIEIASRKKAYDKKNEEFSRLSDKVSENEELLNQYNADIISKMNEATDIKGEISKNTAMLEQLKKRKAAIGGDIAVLEAQQDERKTALAVARREIERADAEALVINSKTEKLGEQSRECTLRLDSDTDAMRRLERELGDKQSRIHILSELEKSYEGYYGGVKAVLAKRDTDSRFKGVCGAVGELVGMDKQYETAIEIALGGAVQNIVVENENDAKAAIAFLKQSGKGRATFLPMSAIKSKTLGTDKTSLLKHNGVIGTAKELVVYDSRYEGIFSSLLERVIVTDNIDNAVALARATKYSYKIVTLDGDLLNIGGSMTGGSINKKSAGIFSRGRELTELKDAIEALSKEREILARKIKDNTVRGTEIVSELEELKKDLQELNITRAEALSRKTQCEEYLNDIEDRINNVKIEAKQLNELLAAGETTVNEQSERLERVNKDIRVYNEKLEEFQNKIQQDRSIKEENLEEISSMRVELNQLENDIYSLKTYIKRIKDEIEAINNQMGTAKEEMESYASRLVANDEEIKLEKEHGEKLKSEYTELMQGLSDMNDYKAAINKNAAELEKSSADLAETRLALEKQLNRQELKKEQADNSARALYDSMWEKYEITYVIAKGYEKLEGSDEELRKEEKQLKDGIKALGNVNMNAVEEYTSVKERFDFLTKNRLDIIATEKKLLDVIDRLNELMEKQFSEQFAIIAKNFSQTFVEMFGGGVASLRLCDSEDILGSGIDIIVQPPGKALQNMMLLSGGEKALTAIALLFAILKMKPSPFCILDEIEAALDDANVNRYADYLNNFTRDTQFIVITHRKGTMEAADILYGVTMQEQGVSKLVSVDFKDKSDYMEESV